MVRHPRKGRRNLWQLDKQIDRERHVLQDLERNRARVANDEHDEVYFAYCFDQEGIDQLNPRLVQLMQQRLGTLAHYDYAFCRPDRGTAYHVVLSNRSHRQLGFSLQQADRVYFQPVQWRRWGVNLFLPYGSDLAPRIDNDDAIPVLQEILKKSQSQGEDDNAGVSLADSAAVLWDAGAEGKILETRVKETRPLLSQYQLLNMFQRSCARHVAESTRHRLADGVRAARQRVDVRFDELTRELLTHIGERTERLDSMYSELEAQLQQAKQLIDRVEPKVKQASEVILNLPQEWVAFVNRVIDVHREITSGEVAEFGDLRQELHAGNIELRTLAARGRDLKSAAESRVQQVQEGVEECVKSVEETEQFDRQIEQLAVRANGMFQEIGRMHSRLEARLAKVQAMQKRAEKMEEEIDAIDEKERQTQEHLAEVTRLRRRAEDTAAEVEKMRQDSEVQEQALLRKSTDLARSRTELKDRALRISRQLGHIEAQLQLHVDQAAEMSEASLALDEETLMVDAQADALAMWDEQRERWSSYIGDQRTVESTQIADIHSALNRLSSGDQKSPAHEQIELARKHLAQAEKMLGTSGNR